MRLTLPMIALSLVAWQASAQTTTAPAPTATAPAATTPSGAAPAATTATPHARGRMTLQQRFDGANTTHDGKLTLDQAKAGMPMVAKHFSAIDKDKKGYVTVDDVHSYAAERRAQHQAHKAASPS